MSPLLLAAYLLIGCELVAWRARMLFAGDPRTPIEATISQPFLRKMQLDLEDVLLRDCEWLLRLSFWMGTGLAVLAWPIGMTMLAVRTWRSRG